jgi:hypothetical protein
MSYRLGGVLLWSLDMSGKCRQIRRIVLRVARTVLLDVEGEDESIDGEIIPCRRVFADTYNPPIFNGLRCAQTAFSSSSDPALLAEELHLFLVHSASQSAICLQVHGGRRGSPVSPLFRCSPIQPPQLNVLYRPMPTSVADIVRIPSCLEPYLYLDLLISIALRCSLKFFMPVK